MVSFLNSLFYYFLKYLCRIGLPFYFGRVEINGLENIPVDSPVIFAPNHRNAFLDAVLVAVYTNRPIHFLTRSDVFVRPFKGVLNAINMMPVYRRRDGYNQLAKNEIIFAKCVELLSQKKRILIFPEGNQANTLYLRDLTKGTARLAFQAQRESRHKVVIVPVGINYFDMFEARWKVNVNFGKGVVVREFLAEYEENTAQGLKSLRDVLSEKMRSQLLIPSKDEQYEVKLMSLNPTNERLPFEELRKQIKDLSFERYHYRAALQIPYQLGLIFNLPPVLLIRWIIRRKIRDPQFIGPVKFVIGMILLPIWWLLILTISQIYLGGLIAVIMTIGIVLSLFVAYTFKKRSHPHEVDP